MLSHMNLSMRDVLTSEVQCFDTVLELLGETLLACPHCHLEVAFVVFHLRFEVVTRTDVCFEIEFNHNVTRSCV